MQTDVQSMQNGQQYITYQINDDKSDLNNNERRENKKVRTSLAAALPHVNSFSATPAFQQPGAVRVVANGTNAYTVNMPSMVQAQNYINSPGKVNYI